MLPCRAQKRSIARVGNGFCHTERDSTHEHGNMKFPTFYHALEVACDASPEQIKNSHNTLARKWHPDRHSGQANKNAANVRMVAINEAWATLRDPAKRRAYDIELKAKGLYQTRHATSYHSDGASPSNRQPPPNRPTSPPPPQPRQPPTPPRSNQPPRSGTQQPPQGSKQEPPKSEPYRSSYSTGTPPQASKGQRTTTEVRCAITDLMRCYSGAMFKRHGYLPIEELFRADLGDQHTFVTAAIDAGQDEEQALWEWAYRVKRRIDDSVSDQRKRR